MNEQYQALRAELIKNQYANIIWITFVAFALAPMMGGIFMLILRNPDAIAKAGALNTKAQTMNFSVDWGSYLVLLTQAVGVGGLLIFGFVASWIFGREYSDGTAKDLLALPTSRAKIINAKFFVYGTWCFALAISNLLLGVLIGMLLQIDPLVNNSISAVIWNYLITTVLAMLVGMPVAFFALCGKGYLTPLGLVTLMLVFAQVMAAKRYGAVFPWSVRRFLAVQRANLDLSLALRVMLY